MRKLLDRYYFIVRVLQFYILVNTVFVLYGAVSLSEYLKNSQTSALTMSLVGAVALVLGFVLPAIIINNLNSKIQNLIKAWQNEAARWAAELVKLSQSKVDDPLKSPVVWAYVGLLGVEMWSGQSKHPMAEIITEMAPLIRKEILKSEPKKKRKKEKVTVAA